MSEDVPESLEIEHEHLRSELHKAVAAGGRIGQAAERVLKVLRPHILLEEEFAIPPLTLLPRLARGEVTPDMRRYMTLAETLQAELPTDARRARPDRRRAQGSSCRWPRTRGTPATRTSPGR